MLKTVNKPEESLPGKMKQMIRSLYTDRQKLIDAGNGSDFTFFIGNRIFRLTKKGLQYEV
jgi:hypothetical protein